jgi:hypothetical protein
MSGTLVTLREIVAFNKFYRAETEKAIQRLSKPSTAFKKGLFSEDKWILLIYGGPLFLSPHNEHDYQVVFMAEAESTDKSWHKFKKSFRVLKKRDCKVDYWSENIPRIIRYKDLGDVSCDFASNDKHDDGYFRLQSDSLEAMAQLLNDLNLEAKTTVLDRLYESSIVGWFIRPIHNAKHIEDVIAKFNAKYDSNFSYSVGQLQVDSFVSATRKHEKFLGES